MSIQPKVQTSNIAKNRFVYVEINSSTIFLGFVPLLPIARSVLKICILDLKHYILPVLLITRIKFDLFRQIKWSQVDSFSLQIYFRYCPLPCYSLDWYWFPVFKALPPCIQNTSIFRSRCFHLSVYHLSNLNKRWRLPFKVKRIACQWNFKLQLVLTPRHHTIGRLFSLIVSPLLFEWIAAGTNFLNNRSIDCKTAFVFTLRFNLCVSHFCV